MMHCRERRRLKLVSEGRDEAYFEIHLEISLEIHLEISLEIHHEIYT